MNVVITAWTWDWRRLGEAALSVPDNLATAALAGNARAHLLLSVDCDAFARTFSGHKDIHTTITDRPVREDELDQVRAYHAAHGPHTEEWIRDS